MSKEYNDRIHVHCKRDFKGMIDIRDYTVEKAIEKNKPIIVTCDTLPGVSGYTPQQLKEDKLATSKEFSSEFNNSTYKLISYEWKGKE